MLNLGNLSPEFFVNMATIVSFILGVLTAYFFFISSGSFFKRDMFPLIVSIVIVFFITVVGRELILNSNMVKNMQSNASLTRIIEKEQQRAIDEAQTICVQRLIKNGSLNKNNLNQYKLAKETCLENIALKNK